MNKDKQHAAPNEEQQPDKVARRTTHLPGEDMERMPDTGDDYRLPRELPEPETQAQEETRDHMLRSDDLPEDSADVSPEELALLESTDYDDSSDESQASDLLDNTDEDGDALNEEGTDSLFDTGEDLDMPRDVTNPDADIDEEDY